VAAQFNGPSTEMNLDEFRLNLDYLVNIHFKKILDILNVSIYIYIYTYIYIHTYALQSNSMCQESLIDDKRIDAAESCRDVWFATCVKA